MEFFLGFLVTVLTTMIVAKKFQSRYDGGQRINISFSQSRKFSLSPESYSYLSFYAKKDSQSKNYVEKNGTRILIFHDQAYWIKDNALYVANFGDAGVDASSAKVVDTMAMDEVELKKIIYVIDKLTEGNRNDPGNSGDQKL